jgi:restriction system protein
MTTMTKAIIFFVVVTIIVTLLKDFKKKQKYYHHKNHQSDNITFNKITEKDEDLQRTNALLKQAAQKEKNIQKGKDYEAFVSSYYETLGYDVKAFGFERGKLDGGIDIVAVKNGETLFIQCKNWNKDAGYKINHENIKAFIGSVSMFKIKYSEYKDVKETLLYVTSEDIFDSSAKKYCQEYKEYVRYKVLPIDKIQRYTTARLAILYDMTTKDMETLLIGNGYLEQKEKGLYLTDKGKEIGEWRKGDGKGYFLWNANIELE